MEAIRIRTDQAQSGMVVANDVYATNNQLVLPKGSVLEPKMISRLRFYGIYGFYIQKDEPEQDMIQIESYIETLRNSEDFKKFSHNYVATIDHIEDNFGQIAHGNSEVNLDALLKNTGRILADSRNGSHIMEMLHGIRNNDDITFVHSLNVALICHIFADWLKFSPEDTKILTLSGLMHDIGKMLIPKEILAKNNKLTEDEFNIIKTHTTKGYQLIMDQPIDIRIKYATLMHHERCDGSGYPNCFTRDKIDEFSKIIAIADVYDAMTSKRKYRDAFCPFDVVAEFEREGLQKYDPHYLMVFLERIVHSYLHNIVRLNDGRQGEVIMINKYSLAKPIIRIGDTYIDLSKERKIKIIEII
ncbi:MAG: hypothetical protein K0S47_640 [Herbinix sp.]|jgi:putative nucleotidyltransferase with HDIG domain|nr:hypothetical protein [Herbinix sp.]